ncbi:MAG: hypothetical protein I8H74_07845 [Moraxellaceae bacterium]|nr:hypothetical protein [Moraxellaceae bacterium]
MSKKPLFKLGQVVATVNALTFANQHQIDLFGLLRRHHTGDWGNLCSEDKESNEEALIMGGRIFSSYQYETDKIWIITEADRSVTTILLPIDY